MGNYIQIRAQPNMIELNGLPRFKKECRASKDTVDSCAQPVMPNAYAHTTYTQFHPFFHVMRMQHQMAIAQYTSHKIINRHESEKYIEKSMPSEILTYPLTLEKFTERCSQQLSLKYTSAQNRWLLFVRRNKYDKCGCFRWHWSLKHICSAFGKTVKTANAYDFVILEASVWVTIS